MRAGEGVVLKKDLGTQGGRFMSPRIPILEGCLLTCIKEVVAMPASGTYYRNTRLCIRHVASSFLEGNPIEAILKIYAVQTKKGKFLKGEKGVVQMLVCNCSRM